MKIKRCEQMTWDVDDDSAQVILKCYKKQVLSCMYLSRIGQHNNI